MAGKLNNWFRLFFTLSKSEQRGIIILTVIIVSIGSLNFFIPYFENSELRDVIGTNQEKINRFLTDQQRIKDSINHSRSQNANNFNSGNLIGKLPLFNFNPNNLPETEWKKLGFSDHQIKNIKNYESAGGKFKSKKDLKKIYTISDDEFAIIEPFIVIPEERVPTVIEGKHIVPTEKELSYKSVNINIIGKSELQKSINTPDYLTKRILSYRDLLGGFATTDQLKEVYGLNDSLYQVIKQYILIDTSNIKKFNINTVKFKELLKHPYFDYNTTVAIFNVRKKVRKFDDLNQIRMIEGIEDSLAKKLIQYLYIQQTNEID